MNQMMLAAILIALVVAVWYVASYPPVPGIQISCSSHKILGFGRVPPPLAAVVQPEICNVNLNVKYGYETVCSATGYKILNQDVGIIPCDGLINFINKTVKIEAKLYTPDGSYIDSDETTLLFKGL